MADWHELDGPLAAWVCGDGPRVVFAHGFTQTSRSWRPIAERVAASGYQAVVVDLPGHGGSADVRANLVRGADLVADTTGGGTYVGYSMGGRFCLHVAVQHPSLVNGLALLGANPGLPDPGERAARALADSRLATHLDEVGLEAFLGEWTSLPLFGDYVPSPAELDDRLRNTVGGLARSLTDAGTGTQDPLWDALPRLAMPVLALAGEHDHAYVAIAERIAAAVANGAFAVIPGAWHAAHAQQPVVVGDLLLRWLSATSGRADVSG